MGAPLGKPIPTFSHYGTCECIREPRGEHGLEGWTLGTRYPFYAETLPNLSKRFRVFGSDFDEAAYRYGANFAHCADGVRTGTFRRYFKTLEIHEGNPLVPKKIGVSEGPSIPLSEGDPRLNRQ